MNDEQEHGARGLARSQANDERHGARGLARSQANDERNGDERASREKEMRLVEGRGWHSRGYLPHFDRRYSVQSITIHLGDSLPQEKLQRLEEELKDLSQSERDLKRRQTIQSWLDAGHGSCVLRHPRAAAILEATLLHFDGIHYRLLEWVVMPNHLHVLIEIIGTMTLGDIVKGWKTVSAKAICEALAPAPPLGARQPPGALPFAQEEKTSTTQEQNAEHQASAGEPPRSPRQDAGCPLSRKGFWHLDFFDRFIRNGEHYANAVRYIHNNPKEAGLVREAQDWPWGSARFLPPREGRKHEER
ncbi:MAG: hypothetical protein RL095_3528 [Verrucomicrobiota bacterium]|jgi:REP element-mobilizing transposase RayT